MSSQKSILQDSLLMYFLISLFYGPKTLLIDFVWAIDSQPLNNSYIILPPFYFVEEGFDSTVLQLQRKSMSSFTQIRIPQDSLTVLRNKLQEVQNKLH